MPNVFKSALMTAAGAAVFISAPAFAGQGVPGAVPGYAQPGQCYKQVKIPAKYAYETKTIVTREGYYVPHVTQAKLKPFTQPVLVKEPSYKFKVTQPKFKSVHETVLVSPEYERLTVSPPKFKQVWEKIQISDPKPVWKRGNPAKFKAEGYKVLSTAHAAGGGYGHSGGYATGEVWCLVVVPAKFKKVERQVLAQPAQIEKETVPAQYKNITRYVVADRGGVEKIHVPGKYEDVTMQKIIRPAGVKKDAVRPETKEIEIKRLVSPERYEWKQVECDKGYGHAPAPVHHTPAPAYGGDHHGGGHSNGHGAGYSQPAHNPHAGYGKRW